jgi:hypothetical protein
MGCLLCAAAVVPVPAPDALWCVHHSLPVTARGWTVVPARSRATPPQRDCHGGRNAARAPDNGSGSKE